MLGKFLLTKTNPFFVTVLSELHDHCRNSFKHSVVSFFEFCKQINEIIMWRNLLIYSYLWTPNPISYFHIHFSFSLIILCYFYFYFVCGCFCCSMQVGSLLAVIRSFRNMKVKYVAGSTINNNAQPYRATHADNQYDEHDAWGWLHWSLVFAITFLYIHHFYIVISCGNSRFLACNHSWIFYFLTY